MRRSMLILPPSLRPLAEQTSLARVTLRNEQFSENIEELELDLAHVSPTNVIWGGEGELMLLSLGTHVVD